jgi:hypothetical protein
MNQPTQQQLDMCSRECGSVGKTGFHSLLCPLSGIDHPSRPGNTYKWQPNDAAASETEQRTQIGNTLHCDDCHQPQDHFVCGDLSDMPWCERCQSYHHATAEHIAKGLETIDLTPESLKTPEGAKRVADAQQEWDSATHQLANTLKEILDGYAYGEGFTGDEIHQLKALIGARDRKQEAFLRAVAGR